MNLPAPAAALAALSMALASAASAATPMRAAADAAEVALVVLPFVLLLVAGLVMARLMRPRRRDTVRETAEVFGDDPEVSDERPDAPESLDAVARRLQARHVGPALGLGILVMPVIFAWPLLSPGYSSRARLVGFGWMALYLFMILNPPAR